MLLFAGVPDAHAEEEVSMPDGVPVSGAAESGQPALSPETQLHRTIQGPESVSKQALKQRANGRKQVTMQRKLLAGQRTLGGKGAVPPRPSHSKCIQPPAKPTDAASTASPDARQPGSNLRPIDGTLNCLVQTV